ncbi:MAG: thioredoxin [Chloroflexi bacterium]|nr:thioredoxin [Chloroflexota bacterium]
MRKGDIVVVTEQDFDTEVLQYSRQRPVVVDFWAPWCGPCRILGPLLERLAQEADGAFRLAKVNVDENPTLAMRYGVRGIPTVKGFVNGQVVGEFMGALPEGQVRAFLRKLAPSPLDLALEKADSLLQMHDWEGAEAVYRDVLEQAPELTHARLGLAKALLMRGRAREALSLLRHFPASREYQAAQTLLPLAEALVWAESHPAGESDDPLEAMYRRALDLIRRGNLEAAMDGLIEIIRRDKHWNNDMPRKVLLGLFEILGQNHPLTRQYRRELSMALF